MSQTWKSRVPKFYRMLLVTEVHEIHSDSFGLILFDFVFLYRLYPVPWILTAFLLLTSSTKPLSFCICEKLSGCFLIL